MQLMLVLPVLPPLPPVQVVEASSTAQTLQKVLLRLLQLRPPLLPSSLPRRDKCPCRSDTAACPWPPSSCTFRPRQAAGPSTFLPRSSPSQRRASCPKRLLCRSTTMPISPRHRRRRLLLKRQSRPLIDLAQKATAPSPPGKICCTRTEGDGACFWAFSSFAKDFSSC